MDLFRRGRIGSGHHVIAQQRHAHRPSLARDVVDRVPGILFRLRGDRAEIPGQAMAIHVTEKNLRVGYGSIGSQRVRHAMEAESHLIQVAFEFEAGRVNKRLILGVVRHLVPVKMGVRRAAAAN